MKSITKILQSYDSKTVDGIVYFDDKYVQNAMQEYADQQTKRYREALIECRQVCGSIVMPTEKQLENLSILIDNALNEKK